MPLLPAIRPGLAVLSLAALAVVAAQQGRGDASWIPETAPAEPAVEAAAEPCDCPFEDGEGRP